MDKFEIRIFNKGEFNSFNISKGYKVDKLLKIIEIFYDELKDSDYMLIYRDKDIKRDERVLSEIFDENGKNEINLNIEKREDNFIYNIMCVVKYDNSFEEKNTQINKNFSFANLKSNLMSIFPLLELGSYTIFYKNTDIYNIYNNEKCLKEIFKDDSYIHLEIFTSPKQIVEYHPICSYCKNSKADNICTTCALYNCNNCFMKDTHSLTKSENFVEIKDFKKWETSSLINILNNIKEKEIENKGINSDDYCKNYSEKIKAAEILIEDLINKIKEIKNIQINNMQNQIDLIKGKHNPENISNYLKNLFDNIIGYKTEPFVDYEESNRKINEFENEINKFNNNFNSYKSKLDLLNKNYTICNNINSKLLNTVKQNIVECKSLFQNKTEDKIDYRIMKVYDNKSVLVYDGKFSLMLFNDYNNYFQASYNNYVQINFDNKLFIVTSQKLFCYDYNTNEMEYVNDLKYSHNWWPVLIKNDNYLLCLTGSYTKNCEILKLGDLKWEDLPNTNSAHGQASGFIDREYVYILFGYDYNLNSIGLVERLSLKDKNLWENINFKNPNMIESILYYHSILKIDENIYILGGLKEIDEGDVVYRYNVDEKILYKTDFNFNIINPRFCCEKNFIKINRNDYCLLDANNNTHSIRYNQKNLEYKYTSYNGY